MSDNHQGESTGKLVVGTFLTLDGVMQAPGGPDEDRDGGFEHGGWMANYGDERMSEVLHEQFAEADALLLGRKTYEIFSSYRPHFEPADDPLATKLNSMSKYVAFRKIRDENSDVRQALDKAFWQPGYFLATTGQVSIDVLMNCVEEQ